MTFSNFKKILDNIREYDEFVDNLYKLGIDVINLNISDKIWENNKILFTEIYGSEGYDWITWYLYEQPHFQKKIEEEGDKKEYHAWDEKGEPMDLSSDDKLWEMLEKEYAVGAKYHNF